MVAVAKDLSVFVVDGLDAEAELLALLKLLTFAVLSKVVDDCIDFNEVRDTGLLEIVQCEEFAVLAVVRESY